MMVNVQRFRKNAEMSWVCEVTSPQAFEGLRMSNREARSEGPRTGSCFSLLAFSEDARSEGPTAPWPRWITTSRLQAGRTLRLGPWDHGITSDLGLEIAVLPSKKTRAFEVSKTPTFVVSFYQIWIDMVWFAGLTWDESGEKMGECHSFPPFLLRRHVFAWQELLKFSLFLIVCHCLPQKTKTCVFWVFWLFNPICFLFLSAKVP